MYAVEGRVGPQQVLEIVPIINATARDVAQMVNQLRSTMQIAGPVAAAVVPAAMAAVKAWKGSMESDPPPAAPADPPAHEHHPHKRKEAEG